MKRAFLFIVVLLLFVGLAGGLGYFQYFVKPEMIRGFISQAPQPVNAVAAARAESENWTPLLPAIGTFRAVQGVEVAPQVGGVVREIRFESSQDVTKGMPLVQIDDSTEQADLKSNEAALKNADISLLRQRQLITGGNTPQANVDTALATRDQAAAAAERTRAVIAQKAVVAPFTGRLGIRRIDVGQYVSPGTMLVTLQQLDPIYVDFSLPEQIIAELKPGQSLETTVDAYPGAGFKGTIKFVEARVNADTRNVMVRGEIANPQKKLLPGMFANVNVLAGAPKQVVTLPRTSISYSLYGDSVYVLNPAPQKPGEAQAASSDQFYTIERRFVRPGDTRDDKVAILEGVKPGELVVSEGQIKLQQNARVRVDPNAGLKPMNPRPRE
ncbi:MAG: efflux RND transporter periplasmic adaptor subunit [Methylobacteriaceae bacterium]|nr:efflux RND transporter periplasmic adaptor subunit [Methylobacteriaceae bacterium]